MAKQLGKYEITRTLGQGAMGEVYLAHHPAIGRDVAIKTILPSAARGEDAEDRFRREATAAGKLNHPNLVTIFDFDKDGDVLYLVMEYVKGDDLDDLIQQRALSQSQFLEVLAQVCDGLSFAHRNGIVHRDIKPTNVRVIRDGKRILAKVMDFGIARVEDSGMTATGIVMGTVSYMAPEYIQSGKAAAQCDLWAVGVMLYECLAGRKPFHADNTTTILFKIVTEAHQPLEPDAIHGVSPSIHAVLAKALDKDPAQRFQSADDFAKALRACKDPTWLGSIDDAVSKIFDRQQALGEAASDDGTVRVTPSLVIAASGSPTLVSVPPPTAVASALPNATAPTTLFATPPAPQPAPPSKGGSKAGLYAAAGLGVVLLAGGGWVLLGRKPQPPTVVAPGPSESTLSQGSPVNAVPAPSPQAAPVETPAAAPSPGTFKPLPTAAAGSPKPEPTKAEVKPEAKPEPPKPVEETSAQKLDKATALLASNPAQAAGLLRSLAASQPGDLAVQGNLLAALYRTHNVPEFEQVLENAKGRGLDGLSMMKAAPAFRQAMMDERRAHRDKDGTNVLPPGTLIKVIR